LGDAPNVETGLLADIDCTLQVADSYTYVGGGALKLLNILKANRP
jgi:hypothetical protein